MGKRDRPADGRNGANGSFVFYKKEQEEKRNAQGIKLTGQDYYTWLSGLSSRWEDMDPSERAYYTQQARSSFAETIVDTLEPDEKVAFPAEGKIWSSVLDAIGDRTSPFLPEMFEAAVKNLMDCDDSMPGFVGYSKKLRSRQLEKFYKTDRGGWKRLMCF